MNEGPNDPFGFYNNFTSPTIDVTGGSTIWIPSQVDTTSAADTTSILNLTVNTTWNYLNNYSEWPKGVSDASFEKKYTPKWHILQGYKNQIDTMWD